MGKLNIVSGVTAPNIRSLWLNEGILKRYNGRKWTKLNAEGTADISVVESLQKNKFQYSYLQKAKNALTLKFYSQQPTSQTLSSYIDSVSIPAASTSSAGIMSSSDKTKLDGFVDLGSFTSTDNAFAKAAEQASNYRTVRVIFYEIFSSGKFDTSIVTGSGIIFQHYYKDDTANTIYVWQMIPCEGKTGKSYRRCINISPSTGERTVGDWTLIS